MNIAKITWSWAHEADYCLITHIAAEGPRIHAWG